MNRNYPFHPPVTRGGKVRLAVLQYVQQWGCATREIDRMRQAQDRIDSQLFEPGYDPLNSADRRYKTGNYPRNFR